MGKKHKHLEIISKFYNLVPTHAHWFGHGPWFYIDFGQALDFVACMFFLLFPITPRFDVIMGLDFISGLYHVFLFFVDGVARLILKCHISVIPNQPQSYLKWAHVALSIFSNFGINLGPPIQGSGPYTKSRPSIFQVFNLSSKMILYLHLWG